MVEPWFVLLVVLAGFVAGVVNTVAGGGSFLTLPSLLLLGLSDQVANGSNRVAILLQTVYATWLYHREVPVDGRALGRSIGWLLPGALLGIYAASQLDPEPFRGAVGVFFLVFTVLLWARRKRIVAPQQLPSGSRWPLGVALLFVGVYGGFLQAGVGLLLLMTLPAFLSVDLKVANGLKLALVGIWTLPAVAWFAWMGQVEWTAGIVLGLGNVVGAHFGTRWAIQRGSGLIFAALVGVMVLTGLRLLWSVL